MAPFSNRALASVLEDGRQHRFDAITAAARVTPLSDDALFLLLCEAAETEGLAALQEAANCGYADGSAQVFCRSFRQRKPQYPVQHRLTLCKRKADLCLQARLSCGERCR